MNITAAAALVKAVRAVAINKSKNIYLKAVCDNISRIALRVFEFKKRSDNCWRI